MFKSIFLIISFFTVTSVSAQEYPYPVKYFTLDIEGQATKMAYMDIKPEKPNGQSIILLHGKNFDGLYWKDVIPVFVANGFRVIVPDQVGWGLSSKPNAKYTFERLALNNRILLDSLFITKINVIGHSMGGMLAARFALLYPERTSKLILEDPLGLEDYRKFVPYRTMEQLYQKELNATYDSYKKNHMSYYPSWKPGYELYVKEQARPLKNKDFSSVAWINALTYLMIYEQPVVYELDSIKVPTFIIIGEKDRTIPGKESMSKQKIQQHNYLLPAKKAKASIKNSRLVILPATGHIPHVQTPAVFTKQVLSYINGQ